MRHRRAQWLSLTVGVLHALGLLLVALDIGYSVTPSAYSVAGMTWRYGSLVILAALPVWLALRYRIVTPLAVLVVTTGYVLGMELTPPGPTFRDVAELERLAEPTGVIVVEDGLYIVRYMVYAAVWVVGFLLLGLVEHVGRTDRDWLPAVAAPVIRLSHPASRRDAGIVATLAGLLHAAVMTWFAHRLGVTISYGDDWLLYAFGIVGMVLLAAGPIYVLVRHRMVGPATMLTLFVFLDVSSTFSPGVDSPHALYFGGWFVFLGILLVVAGLEFGLRRLNVTHRVRSIRTGDRGT